jgi:hypothetical protein
MAQHSIWMKSNTNKTRETNASKQDKGFKKQITGYQYALLAACGLLVLAVVWALLPHKPKFVPAAYIKTLKNGHYQMMVTDKPYIVRGVCYNPIPVGQNYDYDWWSDKYKPWIIDGKLMQDMKVNTIRIYQPGQNPEMVKAVIRDMYEKYGIRTLMGHWIGFWEYPCPLYGDPDFQNRIRREILDMVNTYKNEPGILGWVLGNENNYSCLGHVNPWSNDEIDLEPDPQKRLKMKTRIYYSFINYLTKEIHSIDRNHPVGLGNGELIGLDMAKEFCPSVDFVASIIYRGKTFGNLFKSLKSTFDKPLLLTEIGADCYDAFRNKEDQNMQAFFLESQWRQITDNLANAPTGAGNCLGGVIFEWTDEWWKHNMVDPAGWAVHDTESNWSNGSYYFDIQAPKNMNMNEEWFGIVALSSDEKESGLDKRLPRKAYYVLRELWRNPKPAPKNNTGKGK